MRQHNRPKGPLHGLPISVKEHIYFKGTKATAGMMAWADQESPDDALIVRTFREQGAVFHVKTTNPQTLMALETVSNLFGRTTNPYNTNLTSGGSSGGESALLAMRGSPLGIGTDIGGSIRVPSAFCGIYGLKPSVSRTPHSGLSGLHGGMQNIIGVVGPMAHCVEDMELFMSAALYNSPWRREPAIIPKPWLQDQPGKSHLKIGIMWDDGFVHPHPPVTRAMRDAAVALQAAGHTLVDWKPLYHEELFTLTNKAYFLDGGAEYRETAREGNEPCVRVIDDLLKTYGGQRHSLEETWKLNADIDKLRTLYASRWNAAGIDCLLCPIAPSVASVHDETKYWGYSCVFNSLDYPGTVIPVGHVEPTDTWANFPRTRERANAVDGWYEGLYDGAHGPKRYEGAPIALQIVGTRLEEEQLLLMTKTIDEVLHQRSAPVYNGLEAPVKNPWPAAKSVEPIERSL